MSYRYGIQVTTWVGSVAFGATHYYGKAWRYEGDKRLEEFDIEYPLTQREATEINKADWRSGRFEEGRNMYRKGYIYNGFSSEELVLKHGVRFIHEYWNHTGPIELGEHYNSDSELVEIEDKLPLRPIIPPENLQDFELTYSINRGKNDEFFAHIYHNGTGWISRMLPEKEAESYGFEEKL